jgi:hypothetical protein
MTEAGEDEEMDETTSLFPSILVAALTNPSCFFIAPHFQLAVHGSVRRSFVPPPTTSSKIEQEEQTMAPPAATDVSEVFYTLDEIQKHASAEDCWLIIGNAKTGTFGLIAFFFLRKRLVDVMQYLKERIHRSFTHAFLLRFVVATYQAALRYTT